MSPHPEVSCVRGTAEVLVFLPCPVSVVPSTHTVCILSLPEDFTLRNEKQRPALKIFRVPDLDGRIKLL